MNDNDGGPGEAELILRTSAAIEVVRPRAGVRKQRRVRVLVAAALDVGDAVIPVNLLNLSPTGALIDVERPLDVECKVVLLRNTLRSAGRVVRVEGGRCAIRFDRRISALEVAAAAHPRGRVPRPVI